MMKFLRSQSQTVLVIVLGVIGLGFLFYGSSGTLLTSSGGRGSNDYGSIDGENLSLADLSRAIRNVHDELTLQGQPASGSNVAQQAWMQLLLDHEADRLHIEVSDKEVIDYIHNIPMFQKNGVFNADAYQTQMTLLQAQYHITPDGFAGIARENIRSNAVVQALFSTIHAPVKDVTEDYGKFYGPASISLVTFDPKTYAAAATVTPQEIEAEYKAHPENPAYRTSEKRKVDYVFFLLSPEQAKLADKEKTAAKEALGEKALEFALAFQPDPSATAGTTQPTPDFTSEAKKRNLSPATTDFFTVDTPPANVPPSPSFNSAAFSLTKENPISKVVELDNGVAVLHLVDVQPSQVRPLDEVKAGIEKQLQQTKGSQSAQITAQIDAQLIKSVVEKGTDFKTAATGLKMKVETMPTFVPMKVPQSDQKLQAIAYAVTTLKPGQVSGPIPIQIDNTVVVVHLDSRATADPSEMAGFEKRFRESQNDELRKYVYLDWITWASKRPGTHRPPDLEAYGSSAE